jgi:hypothetical protein
VPRTPPYPPYPPFPPFAPYPPVAPFPPYPPYPAWPGSPCGPCATPGPSTEGEVVHDGVPEGGPSIEDGVTAPPHPAPPDGIEGGPGELPPGPSVEPAPPGGNGVPDSSPGPGDGTAEKPIVPGRISVRRPDDLLLFDASFTGYLLKKDPTRLERSSADAFIVFEFPPQSFGEEAFLETTAQRFSTPPLTEQTEVSKDSHYPKKNIEENKTDAPASALPVSRVRMARPSRIAVTMPAEQTTMGYDLASLLAALRDWPMRLDANAVSDRLFDLATLVQSTHAAGLEDLAISAEAMPTHAELSVFAGSLHGAGATASSADVALVTTLAGLHLKQGPREPASTVTALELPYRVVTSPLAPARWRHAIAPVTRRAHTELWHTRLCDNTSQAGADAATRIRALWSPDYRPKDKQSELIDILNAPPPLTDPPKPNPNLIRMSLDPLDRSMLVTAMSGFDESLKGGADYHPLSSEAKRLHLSSLGALLDAEGSWPKTPEHIDLQQWRHVATLGRDQYVRVMYAGYLWPFGHAASLIKVSERKFESLDGDRTQRVALLRQRFFVAVREPVRTYSGANHLFQGRNFPFTRIELLTRVTPDLSDPGEGDSALQPLSIYGGDLARRMLFWPMVPAGSKLADVPFEIAATDISGLHTTFSMPLLFVGKLAEAKAAAVCKSYNATPASPRRRADTGGAIVTYAPPDPADKGDPKLPTRTISFAAASLPDAIDPAVYPEIDVAEVGIKPIQKLLGQHDFVTEVAYPDFYKAHGFDPLQNKGQVFLKLTKAKDLPFGGSSKDAKSDSLGALATPKMSVLGLSKILGPVSGDTAATPDLVEGNLDKIRGGTFDPASFFKDATLLGGIKLAQILPGTNDLSGSDVPKMVARDFPDHVEARFEWSGDVTKIDKLKLLIPRADPGKPPTHLTMNGMVRTPHDPAQPPSQEATATLTNFKVNLFGFIILWFEEISFNVKNGSKPDVSVRLHEGEEAVSFGGPLEFVNEIRRFIPGNGFSDPPGLSVTPSGLSASYSLNLPAVGVGVFALTNASLGAAFNLPFDSRPASVKFNFSAREHPFSITVSLLGGGGFFAIGVSARGVNEIEAALEFGAAIVIDLGVASGSVEVKAGVYFHWLEVIPDQGSVELAGYVRIYGELTVLALVSVSLTFLLQLGYLKEGGHGIAYGEATLTVEIEILMFSAEVSVKCRREFGGGEADPRFVDLVPTPQLWAAYCDAFADEAV